MTSFSALEEKVLEQYTFSKVWYTTQDMVLIDHLMQGY
uniref:Uncharacterized protein n=1 Tax=Arundo donax TaxID=35708 RepID=A0A0A9I0L2_ARUDO